jgi:hypothetical protein
MAEQQGGYRRPSQPAPVSGPGALSQRTDGQGARYMAGGEYGEGQEMMDLQTSAPMSKTDTMPARRGGAARPMPMMDESEQVTPLFAPTERPGEPITAGAPFGPGAGPSTPPQTIGRLTKTLEKIVAYDGSDRMQYFYMLAQSRGW